MTASPVEGTVLLVEDEPHQREILARIARQLAGGEILVAENGADALAKLDGRGELALLITDLQMPVMDGVALLRHIAERGLTPRVILVSAEHSSILLAAERVARAYGMALLGSVEKPVTRAALQSLLELPLPARPDAPLAAGSEIAPAELRAWMADGHLTADLQPKVNLATGALSGAEALARLYSPIEGVRVPPSRFIPMVEADPDLATEFTLEITRYVAALFGRWPGGEPPPTLSINLPAAILGDVALADRVGAILDEAGVAPARIIWEVTETATMAHLGSAMEVLTRLRLKGSGLSIDDYGTGHSTLDRLTAIPFTEVKLDRAFVQGSTANPMTRKIIASTVQLAHDLGMKCVAEGAETAAEVELLRDLGCDIVQGFAIAAPMTAERFAEWQARPMTG